MTPNVALFCGVPPTCDRCGNHDAKVRIDLPKQGRRDLCQYCLASLVEMGFEAAFRAGLPSSVKEFQESVKEGTTETDEQLLRELT